MENLKGYTNSTVFGDSIIHESVLISDDVAFTITTVNYAVISEAICLFGIFTNIVTIVVLSKQGFRRTVNISLMGLAVSDLCSVFFKACVGVAFNPLTWNEDIAFIPSEMSVLTVAWPHATFTRIAGWITAFVSIERFLCVAVPLTIKRILTPNRNFFIVTCIYLGVIAGVLPNYYTTMYAWKFVPEKNRTLLGIVYSENMKDIEVVSIGINNVFSPLTNFGVVIVCTSILVYNMHAQSKWRKSAASDSKVNNQSHDSTTRPSSSISPKDARVIKLVIILSLIFIISSVPTTACFLWMIVDPEFNLLGRLRNIYDILASSTFVFESTNSSVNLFVYYYTSTEFRDTCHTVFISRKCCKSQPKSYIAEVKIKNSNQNNIRGHEETLTIKNSLL